MSWGITETTSEIEKIKAKAESDSYLIWLNACDVISWNTYCYVSDFYADLLMKAYEQGKKDAQPEPCEDAVSRKAVYKAMVKKEQRSRRYRLGETWELNGAEIREALDTVPSVTLKRKMGQWVPVTNGRGGHECDQCHEYAPSWATGEEHLTNFCPNCGADMRGE